MDFISTIYSSVAARLKTGQLGLAQTSRGRKLTKGKPSDVLQTDPWRKKGRKKRKGGLRGKFFSSVKEKKGGNHPKRYEIINLFTCDIPYYSFEFRSTRSKNKNSSSEQSCNSLSIPQCTTDATVKILGNKPM
jgi:hypothetical protein